MGAGKGTEGEVPVNGGKPRNNELRPDRGRDGPRQGDRRLWHGCVDRAGEQLLALIAEQCTCSRPSWSSTISNGRISPALPCGSSVQAGAVARRILLQSEPKYHAH